MFVLTHNVGEIYGRKNEAYEKMIKEKARNSQYYTEAEIRDRYPSPKAQIIKFTKMTLASIGIVLFSVSFIVYIATHVEVEVENNQTTSQEQKGAAGPSK